MQVFGLPGHLIRNAGRASRLLSAETSTIEGRRPHRRRAKGWSPALRCAVERLRCDFPMWGKDKLGPLLRKAGMAVSNATVGRILKSLVERGRVMPVPQLIRKQARKAAPKSRPHAIRKPKDVFFEKPGDVIQIDTVTLALAQGRTVKHFDAYDVFAKWTVAKPYKSATAANAADFLEKVVAEMPWPIKAIQIDGGSEFMADFENACQERNIPLYVLPPRSPKLNGAVERCNAAWRYEFYATVDLPPQIDKIAEHVEAFQHLYNHHRPHGALDGLTPNEYLHICRNRMTQSSHMC